MRYTIETTDYGVTVYAAIQPDYDHELQVIVTSNNLIYRVGMHPTPKPDRREPITEEQYKSVLANAKKVFNDYLTM
jgi:hypothetical protein